MMIHIYLRLEIWCNEAQERYVLSNKSFQLSLFETIAKRERCPFAVVGVATAEQRLILEDSYFQNKPIDIPCLFYLESRQNFKLKWIQRLMPINQI